MTLLPTDMITAKQQADALIQPYLVKDAPGGLVAVVQGGHSIWSRPFGLSDTASNQPNLPGTRHALASLTKMMVAGIVLKLAARNRIDLQVAASTYMPDVPMLEQMTLAHLLTMTSGLPDHFDLMLMAGGLPAHDRTAEDHLTLLRKIKQPITEAGARFTYGNANYLILAEILKSITGKDFATLMRDEIFKPAGMHDAYVMAASNEIHPRTALPHIATDEGKSWLRGRVRFPSDGIGNVFASLSDMTAWLNVLRTGALGDVDLSPLWNETMIDGKRGVQYGLGMMLRKYRGLNLRGHVGRWAGYRSAMFYAPDIDMGFIVCANRSDFPSEDILFGLIDAFAGKILPLPSLDTQIMANLAKANMPLDAMPKLNGIYIHPESGHVLKLHWQLPYLLAETSSARMLLQCTSHGFFTARWGTTPCHVMPQVDEATKTIALDVIMGGVRRRYNRIQTLGPMTLNTLDYTGDYLQEALEAKMHVFDRGGQLFARIGTVINAGEAYRLHALGADVFEMDDPSPDVHARYIVRFDREPSSRLIRQVIVSGDRLPSLTYRKMRSF